MPPSASQAARDAVVAAIPRAQRGYVDRCLAIVADNVNGTWRRHLGTIYGDVMVGNREDFMRGQAHLHGVSISWIYAKLKVTKAILGDPQIPKQKKWLKVAESFVPRVRPGRSGHSFFTDPENAWMWPELRRIYLNQARHSMRAARDILIEVIKKKQEAWGIGHLYQIPTPAQVRTALNSITKAERVLGREGEEAYRNKISVSLSRRPLETSNALWVTDQREVDVRLRDGGERLGRIWMVNFLDVASFKVLGNSFGPVLNSDMVMQAAAMAIERYGVPGAVQMDLGKEFTCTAFNGSMRKLSGEALYREAKGLWERLDVQIVKAIGNNPQTKPIERWHQMPAKWEKNFPGWCGSNISERPEKLVAEEAQHAAWLKGEAARSPLVKIGDYIRAYIAWVEIKWNAEYRGRGKTLRGMTPNEAFNTKRPAAGFLRISLEELDHATADHRFVKVSRGGQVNLTFYGQTLEYIAPELFNLIDEQAEVIVSRRTFRRVTVIYPVTGGTASCVAELKPELEWLPESREELRAAMRCRAAVRRAVKQGQRASHLALEAANPVELLAAAAESVKPPVAGQKLFGSPIQSPAPSPQHPETGSLEYLDSRTRARREKTKAIQAADVPVETSPASKVEPDLSLYTIDEMTVEER